MAEMKGAIGQLMLCFVDMRALAPEINLLQRQLVEMSDKLDEMQRRRQTKIWAMIEETGKTRTVTATTGESHVLANDNGPNHDDDGAPTLIGSMTLDDFGESECLTLKVEEIVSGFHDVVNEIPGYFEEEGVKVGEKKKEDERNKSWKDDFYWDSIFDSQSSGERDLE